MGTVRRIFWNAALLIVADVLRLVLGFILTPVMARALGSAGLGIFAYVMALVGILGVVADFGLSAFYVREAQRRHEQALAGTALGIRAAIGVLSGAGLALYGLSIDDATLSTLLLLGAMILVFGIPSGHVTAVLRAKEMMLFDAAVRVGGVIVATGGGIVALLAGWGVIGVMGLMAGFSGAVAALSIMLTRRLGPSPQLKASGRAYLETLRGAWPFASLAILVVVYFRVDAVMLYAMRGPEAAGQYAAAYRLMEAALLIPLALAGAALPALARSLTERVGEVLAFSTRALHLLAIISIPGAVLSFILAPRIFPLLYGSGFEEAAKIFRILAFTLVAVFASAVTSSLITASRPIVNTYIAALMVAMNVGMNFVLIPQWGGSGAAVATVLTEATGLILGAVYIRRHIGTLRITAVMIKPAAATLIVAGSAYLYPAVAAIPLYAAAYVVLLWLIGGIGRNDVDFFRHLLISHRRTTQPRRGA